jgi:hypothetical protein
MSPVPEPAAGLYMVVVAWHCSACDVRGRSLTDTEVKCWNCDGPVTITARPSVPVTLGSISPLVIPRPRREPHTPSATEPKTRSGPAPSASVPRPRPPS